MTVGCLDWVGSKLKINKIPGGGNKMDRPTVKVLRKDIQKILDMRMDQLDGTYEMTVGNAKFDGSEVKFDLTVREKGAKTREERHLEQFAPLYDLDLDKIVEVQNMRFKLFGYNPRARINNFWCKNLTKNDGKNYLFSESEVKRLFAKG